MSSGFPEAFVETPLGRLLVWATNERTINAATMTAADKASDDYRDHPAAHACAEQVTINRIPYTVGLHLVTDDHPRLRRVGVAANHHGWALPRDALRLVRTDGNPPLPATQGADYRVRRLVVPALAEWANSLAGTVLRLRAEYELTGRQVRKLTAHLATLQPELARLRQHHQRVAAHLAAAEADRDRREGP
jgi:hypothetical protein